MSIKIVKIINLNFFKKVYNDCDSFNYAAFFIKFEEPLEIKVTLNKISNDLRFLKNPVFLLFSCSWSVYFTLDGIKLCLNVIVIPCMVSA